jgi:hypothetical protein
MGVLYIQSNVVAGYHYAFQRGRPGVEGRQSHLYLQLLQRETVVFLERSHPVLFCENLYIICMH